MNAVQIKTVPLTFSRETMDAMVASAEGIKTARAAFKKSVQTFIDKWAKLNGRGKASVEAMAATMAATEEIQQLAEIPQHASFIKADIKAVSKLALALDKTMAKVNRATDKTPWAAEKAAEKAAVTAKAEAAAKEAAAKEAAVTPLQALETRLIADLAAARKISGAHNLAATLLDAILLINPDFAEAPATPVAEAPATPVAEPKATGAKRRAAK
jgi:hypothetical protein